MSEPDPRSRAEIEWIQLEHLNRLLRTVGESNPFYALRLRAALLDQGVDSLDEFRAKMPFTRKSEVSENQATHPPFGTNLTYPVERYTRFHQTSATTGTPMRWLDTPESWSWMVGNWERVFAEAGVGAGDRVFFAFSFGPFLGFWTAFEAAGRRGSLCIPGGGMSTTARVQAILDNHVTAICCTPTYAIRMGETAREEGMNLEGSSVRVLLAAGEPGGSIPATRRRIETLWPGVRVFDHHGMTEVGPVSYESPNHPGVLHVIETAYLAEVIDPQSGAPVVSGGEGELVLTTLGRVGSPLFRYRTGDLVRPDWDAAKTYGTAELALVGGIIGRVDDMLVVRGVNVCPSAVEEILRSFDDVGEFRVEIHEDRGLSEVKLLVEPVGVLNDAGTLQQEIESRLRTTFNLRFPVQLVEPGSLPRFEMKAKRWIRVQG